MYINASADTRKLQGFLHFSYLLLSHPSTLQIPLTSKKGWYIHPLLYFTLVIFYKFLKSQDRGRYGIWTSSQSSLSILNHKVRIAGLAMTPCLPKCSLVLEINSIVELGFSDRRSFLLQDIKVDSWGRRLDKSK
jgi:hypothetical protein